MNKQVHVPGLPDAQFVRGDVPMSKEEVRALTLCKAKIQPRHIVYDVGAGTGSIAVEAAMMAYLGKIYAVEREPEGIHLIKENMQKFGLQNIFPVHGHAPQALAGLPEPDVVIVGGSGGALPEILDLCGGRLASGGKMLVNAVTLETLAAAKRYFSGQPAYDVDYTCLAVTKALPAGASHIFRAQNPVYIITATKGDFHER